MRYYTRNDEWIDLNGKDGRLGITREGAANLGEVVFVELPAEGYSVAQGDALCTIESIKAAIDFYTPMGGRVVAVNEVLKERPQLLGEKPDETWIAAIEIADTSETETLMDEKAYRKYNDEERDS